MNRLVTLAAIPLAAMLLSGCVPMAFFASSSGAGYRGLKTDWGTYVASKDVNAFCLSPKLRFIIWDIEGYFGRKVVMNSGFRDESHNAAAGGQDNSYHKKCMAADIKIPGVAKSELIKFAMANDGVGGLGCYPARDFIHIDVRSRPRGYNRPVTFNGC